MIALAAAFVAVVLWQLPDLVGRRDKREIVIAAFLYVCALAFCVLISKGVVRPGISNGLVKYGESVLRFLGLLSILESD